MKKPAITHVKDFHEGGADANKFSDISWAMFEIRQLFLMQFAEIMLLLVKIGGI